MVRDKIRESYVNTCLFVSSDRGTETVRSSFVICVIY